MLIKLTEHLKKNKLLSGKFKGTVIDNEDPLKLKRIKVNIPGILEGTKDSLPWCFQYRSLFLGASANSTTFVIPEKNSKVVVEFPYDNPYTPFYVGEWEDEINHAPEFEVDYPNTYGFKDSTGNIYKVNKLKETLEFIHSSGTKINIEQNGDFTVESQNNQTFKSAGDNTFESTLHDIKADLIQLGGTSDSAVLFSALKSMLESLIDAVAAHTHATTPPGPPTPPTNASAITGTKTSIDAAESSKVKLD